MTPGHLSPAECAQRSHWRNIRGRLSSVACAVVSFEQACSDTERAAEAARKCAGNVVSQARALAKAAQTGNIAGIKRCREKLNDALTALRQEVANAGSCWPFSDEEEQLIFGEQYIDAIKTVADAKGLRIHEQDELLISYPSIVRVLPAERAVRVDKKRVVTVRPSYLVDLLLANQKKSSGFPPQRFLESLYSVYTDIVDRSSSDILSSRSGSVVPLARIYKLMTSLPGAARDYDRNDFARDLYLLDSNGPRRTRNGATVSFPSSTGTRKRSRDLFSFIGPEGDNAEYYGIRFSESDG